MRCGYARWQKIHSARCEVRIVNGLYLGLLRTLVLYSRLSQDWLAGYERIDHSKLTIDYLAVLQILRVEHLGIRDKRCCDQN